MPRSSLILGCALAIGGCTATGREAVFVDWNRVNSSLVSSPTSLAHTPKPPPSNASLRYDTPGMRAETASTASSKKRLESARAVIAANLETAFNQLSNSLMESYRLDLDRIERQRLAELDPDLQKGFSEAFDLISAVFLRYANRRSPWMAELAMLAGFPDSDPRSQRTAPEGRRFIREKLERAATLRGMIAKLDKDFKTTSQTLVDSAELAHLDELTRLRIEMESLRNAADARAKNEAKKLLDTNPALKSIFEDSAKIVLPAVPGSSVRVESRTDWPSPVKLDVPDHREEQVRIARHDLELWMATRGYTSAANGRDATEEFLIWRKTLQPELLPK